MLFSLIIPTYNNCRELLACLEAVSKLRQRDFEVKVCVDGSTDNTLEALASGKWNFPLEILTHPDGRNHGRSTARNLALHNLHGRFVLFLDSDMRPSPDLLDRHLEVLVKGDIVSIGIVQYEDSSRNAWVRYLSQRGVAKYQHGAKVPHNYFITPNTALPAEWFRQLGGFDEEITGYGGEDMELGYRLFMKFHPGFVCNRQAVVHTHQEKQLPDALKQLREYGATGLRHITTKWPDLAEVYWVNRVGSTRLKDRLLRFILKPFFRFWVKLLLPISPWFLKRELISYLVVAHVHEGFRGRP